MPTVISKAEALACLESERSGSCALCDLCQEGSTPRYVLEEGRHAIALLPRYARRWGHVMIVLREHRTAYRGLPEAHWQEAMRLALRAAQAIESALSPQRCYVASLGAAVPHPLTYPHLHIHVIPVYEASDTPSTVLTASAGVLVGLAHEWAALREQLLSVWEQPSQ